MTNVISARAIGRPKLAVLQPPTHVSRKGTDMKRILLCVALVAALAIPTAAVAAGHRSTHKAKSGSVAAAPKTKAKGSAPRSGLAVTVKPSKNVPAGTKTKAHAKPKAGTGSGRKPKTAASAGTAEHVGEGSAEQDGGHSRRGRDLEPARRFGDVGEAGDRRHRPPDLDQRNGHLTDQRQRIT
jgi:hypothetical protein